MQRQILNKARKETTMPRFHQSLFTLKTPSIIRFTTYQQRQVPQMIHSAPEETVLSDKATILERIYSVTNRKLDNIQLKIIYPPNIDGRTVY